MHLVSVANFLIADPGRVFCQGTDHHLVQTPGGPIIDVLHPPLSDLGCEPIDQADGNGGPHER